MYYSIKLKTIPTSPPKVFKAFWSSLFALESTFYTGFVQFYILPIFYYYTNKYRRYICKFDSFLFEVSINNSIIQDEIRHFLKWSNFKIFRYIRFKTSLLRNKIFMHSFSILDLIWQAPKTRRFLRWHVFNVSQNISVFKKLQNESLKKY